MFLPSLARVSRDDQIYSLDVTKAAQLLEKRGEVWIVSAFAHISDGGRGVNEGNVVRFRRLLRTRSERPGGRCTAKQRDELTPPHSITSSAVI
jgi:hypothetical protein